MRPLLLLFILFPAILFGQMRQKAIIDSIKATSNLQHISTVVSSYPDTRVESVRIADSGQYITLTVRIHIPEANIIPVLPTLSFTKLAISDIVPGKLSKVNVPPLPPPIVEMDTVPALPLPTVTRLYTRDVSITKLDTVIPPPLPAVKPIIDALLLPVVTRFRIKDIAVVKADTATIPPLPDIETGIIDSLPSLPMVILVMKYPLPVQIDTASIPVLEEVKLPVAEMHLSDEGYSLLEKLEGFSPDLYSLKDGGFTIGFGFFVPYSEGKKWNKGVTWEEAERLIRQKVPMYEDQVKQYINVPLTQVEFDALTMLAYNLGGFSKATSIVNDMNSNADFDKLRSDWMRFVHSKAPGVMNGLINRRRDEIQVRNEANYQPERKIQILKNGK